MRVLLAVTLVLAVWAAEGSRQKRTYPTRCFPGTTCWPSAEDIAHLQKYTSGQVYQPSSTSYRTNVLYVNERVTKHPGLVLVALSVDDVMKGVIFARKNHLLLAYRGSNALTFDLTGRLSEDGGFVIDMSNLRGVSPSVVSSSISAGTVTVQAGATWQDVYTAVEQTGRVVVGTNPTDGVYESTLTGGISVLSRTLGLVSDNLLSAQVVLADGRLATVSGAGVTIQDVDGKVLTSDDAELFYALRGGGFNFALPVSFTFRLHFPPQEMASFSATYNLFVDGTFLGRDALKFLLREVTSLPAAYGGYIMVDGSPSRVDPADKGTATVNLLHYGQWNFFNPNTGQTSLTSGALAINALQQYTASGNRNAANVNVLNDFAGYRGVAGEADVFDSWPNKYVTNTLVDSSVFTNNTKLDEFVELLLGVVNAPAVDSNYRCIARLLGGQISAQGGITDAITQEYRDASMSVTCGLAWRDSMLREDFYVSHAMLAAKELKRFGRGVDPRFAPEDLENWKAEVFGSKYASLLEVKSRWDTDNFLWTHNHVASDFRLNCRKGHCH